jgi:hypothetical protein
VKHISDVQLYDPAEKQAIIYDWPEIMCSMSSVSCFQGDYMSRNWEPNQKYRNRDLKTATLYVDLYIHSPVLLGVMLN